MIKILIDMNLSPKWVKIFIAQGWEAVHWSEFGAIDAQDQVILKWAKDNDFIVFTHDLDFGALLAAGGARGPSVIQIRTQNITPEAIGKLVTDAINQFKEELVRGALISVTPRRSRARILPLR
jgi:predicted nuclease of predicted toxin-antitoxin system